MEFKLKPVYLRQETEPGYEREAWRPTWKCFCCHDSGLVKEHLVKQIIDDYDHRTQKLVKCNATGCKSPFGENLIASGTLDCRFPSEICDRLASEEKEMWRKDCSTKHQKRKIRLKNTTRNLRLVSRTPSEHWSAQRKHEDLKKSL